MKRLLALLLVLCACAPPAQGETVRVGAKNFTEQEILAEIAAQLIERGTSLDVERRLGLGGTDICHAALRSGEIDLYVEYTGTALLNVLKRAPITNGPRAFRRVAGEYRERFELEWLPPIGFDNTYAIAVRADQAEERGWASISDLAGDAPALSAGFTSEFMERPDGYAGLATAYALEFQGATDLDPGLLYDALSRGGVDVIGAFATDARIAEYGFRVLADDRSYFPPYDAAPLIRAELFGQHPEIRDALSPLAGAISDDAMRRLNHAVDVDRRTPADVAREWVDDRLGVADDATDETPSSEPAGFLTLLIDRRSEVLAKTGEHLVLTAIGAGVACAIGVPLGVFVHRKARARGVVLAATEVVQTIPSLAMLAFLFAVYGLLGALPAVTALVLYALLPIVLNTYTGLKETPAELVEAARGVGMSSRQRLTIVELPLAAPVIIAGIRAATVLTVGVATLSTYIGAGGLGDFIARGLARNDPRLTLLGALPAAALAVTLSLALRHLERAFRHRRQG